VLIREEVVLARTDQGDRLTRVIVEHVTKIDVLSNKLPREYRTIPPLTNEVR
jgi:hypothetical protein